MPERLLGLLGRVNPWIGIAGALALSAYQMGRHDDAQTQALQALSTEVQALTVQVNALNLRVSRFICAGKPDYLCQ